MKDCEIVKDLLPLVAEDMASEESKTFVNAHIETCEDCRKAYEALKTPVQTDDAAPLKAVRKNVKKRGWLIAGLIACLVAALLFGTLARLFKPIPMHSAEEAFESVEVLPQTIRLEPDSVFTDPESRFAELFPNESAQDVTINWTVVLDSDGTGWTAVITSDPSGNTESAASRPTETDSQTKEIKAEIVSTPAQLILTADPKVGSILVERPGGEISVTAVTTLWRQWFPKENETVRAEIDLSDVDAVFLEPYNNTERETLYLREGYQPEAGFALPRLVMNYYFAIALIATVALFVPWLVLLLSKKKKARRVFDILLLIPLCGTVAFLIAGFPATTISPLRDLMFICAVAVLLFGAGLSARALLKKD